MAEGFSLASTTKFYGMLAKLSSSYHHLHNLPVLLMWQLKRRFSIYPGGGGGGGGGGDVHYSNFPFRLVIMLTQNVQENVRGVPF